MINLRDFSLSPLCQRSFQVALQSRRPFMVDLGFGQDLGTRIAIGRTAQRYVHRSVYLYAALRYAVMREDPPVRFWSQMPKVPILYQNIPHAPSSAFGLNGNPSARIPFILLKNCAPSTNRLSLLTLEFTKSG